MIKSKRQLRRSAALALALCAVALPAAGHAQGARRVQVSIAAQPMDRALEQLARQSGQDILFTRAAVSGMTAPAAPACRSCAMVPGR